MLGMPNQPYSSYDIRIYAYHLELGYARSELRYRRSESKNIPPAQSSRYKQFVALMTERSIKGSKTYEFVTRIIIKYIQFIYTRKYAFNRIKNIIQRTVLVIFVSIFSLKKPKEHGYEKHNENQFKKLWDTLKE